MNEKQEKSKNYIWVDRKTSCVPATVTALRCQEESIHNLFTVRILYLRHIMSMCRVILALGLCLTKPYVVNSLSRHRSPQLATLP